MSHVDVVGDYENVNRVCGSGKMDVVCHSEKVVVVCRS